MIFDFNGAKKFHLLDSTVLMLMQIIKYQLTGEIDLMKYIDQFLLFIATNIAKTVRSNDR